MVLHYLTGLSKCMVVTGWPPKIAWLDPVQVALSPRIVGDLNCRVTGKPLIRNQMDRVFLVA